MLGDDLRHVCEESNRIGKIEFEITQFWSRLNKRNKTEQPVVRENWRDIYSVQTKIITIAPKC